jgi:predicted transposase YbfD/YdcC
LTETTHGQVFTLDALHCQKQTTTLITKYKNDYIIPLKPNPKNLSKAVKIRESQLLLSESQTVDIGHGSQIVRKVSVFDIDPLKSADFDGSHWG